MKRLLAALALLAALFLVCRVCGPLFDAIDRSPCCCPVACIVGLLAFVMGCVCCVSGDISEAEEQAGMGRRS